MSDYERERAVMEGEMIAAGEAYFAARPQMDMPNTRKAYDAGFQAGRDARRAGCEAGEQHLHVATGQRRLRSVADAVPSPASADRTPQADGPLEAIVKRIW